MKKLFLILVLGIFLISFISFTSAWTSVDFTLDQSKQIEMKDSITSYGKYEIKDYAWYDILKIWTEEKIKEVVLEENTPECSDNCFAIKEVTNLKPMPLIEDVRFFREIDGKWVAWNSFTNWRIEVEEDVEIFETICKDGKEIIDEKNGTSYKETICENVFVRKEKQWKPLDYKKDYEGTYRVKLSGSKKPSVKYDWQVKIGGEWTTAWAIWGNISEGDEAEVILNSPADDSTTYVNEVQFNATANVTGGAYLTNMSLWTNETGSWGLSKSTNIDIEDSLTTSYTNNGFTTSNKLGLRILALNNTILSSAKIADNGGMTKAYIEDSDRNILKSIDIVGNIAEFNYYLEKGNYYYITTDNDGDSYQYITSSGQTMPENLTEIQLVNSVTKTGTSSTTFYGGFLNLSFGNYDNGYIAFTNTYSSGDTVLWNVQACDSDGDCGFAVSNRTFSIDDLAPQITLNYPTSLIDYGKVNNSLQLNFTATDTNLDKVWYDYNGTNVTITGASSGVYNISNITLSTKKNVTIYANDTAGNLNTTTFSWDYKVFEESNTFNSSTAETASETFSVNLTANASLTAVTLDYNGTDYAMTKSGTVYSKTLDIPEGISNRTLRYKLTYAGDTIYSDYFYQNVSLTYFTLCNATYTTPFLNISFKDEANLAVLNATIPTSTFIYYLGTGTVNKTLTYINNTENYYYQFCATPTDRNLTVDPYLQYKQGLSYPQRIWNPDAQTYSNVTTNETLYLLGTGGQYVTIQVTNQADQLISGVTITVERIIDGETVEVGKGTTGDDGTFTFWLNPDFSHTFTLTKEGYTTTSSSFLPTQSSYTFTLGESYSAPSSYTRGMVWILYPQNSSLTNDTIYNFGMKLTSNYWDLESFGFNLRLVNGTIITGTTSTTSGTTITIAYNTTNQSRIFIDYYWIVEGNTSSGSAEWRVYSTEYTQWSVRTFFDDFNAYLDSGLFGIDDFGRYLLIFLIIFLTVGILGYKIGYTNPLFVTGLIFFVIFFFDVAVGLIPSLSIAGGREVPYLLTIISGLIFVVSIISEGRQ